jgi:hypothetical protein
LQSLIALQRPGDADNNPRQIPQNHHRFPFRFHPSFPAGGSLQTDASESPAADQRPAASLRRVTSMNDSSRGMVFGFKRGSSTGLQGLTLRMFVMYYLLDECGSNVCIIVTFVRVFRARTT